MKENTYLDKILKILKIKLDFKKINSREYKNIKRKILALIIKA